jgi:hypothetical protein
MKKSILCGMIVAALACAVSPALAADIKFSTAISQDAFKSLSKQAGVSLGYRNMAPAEPLGITGFDIGAEATAISIDKNSEQWKAAFNNDAPSYLIIPKLRARKGLPYGIDVGGMYAYIPGSNVKLFGFELSKAILDGTMATPAVGIRGTYTKLTGVDDLGLSTYGVDASISKGFVFITPYAGAGVMWVSSEAKGNLRTVSQAASIDLKSETFTVPRVFGGLKISPFPLLSITAEAEYANNPLYSFKAAISF